MEQRIRLAQCQNDDPSRRVEPDLVNILGSHLHRIQGLQTGQLHLPEWSSVMMVQVGYAEWLTILKLGLTTLSPMLMILPQPSWPFVPGQSTVSASCKTRSPESTCL